MDSNQNRVPTVFMVAEKPQLAKSISEILSGGLAKKRKGFNHVCSIYEYNGQFRGQNAHFKMTSTCGHIMETDFVGGYSWNRVDPSELYRAPIRKKEVKPMHKMNAFLASEAKGCDYLVLWLDCDDDGENICFEVLDATSMRQSDGSVRDSVFRAHFSAVTEFDITKAMKHLRKPDKNLSLSVDARQELDLRIGCSFTRLQTKSLQDEFGDLMTYYLPFGPCLTLILNCCVEQSDKIKEFKQKSYYVIQMELSTGGMVWMAECKEHFDKKEEAQTKLNSINDCIKDCKDVDVYEQMKMKQPPKPMNTFQMLRDGSSCLKKSPPETMSKAQSLYDRGYISYPRTETSRYPDRFDFQSALNQQQCNRKWRNIIDLHGIENFKKPHDDRCVDKGDHPPITPLKSGDGLGYHDKSLYDLITKNLIASLMGPCLFSNNKIQVGGQTFEIHESEFIYEPGFTAVMTNEELETDDTMTPLKRSGETLRIDRVELVERQTRRPDHLTEADLVTLMENFRIGTDGSVATHIGRLEENNFVRVTKVDRKLIPTELGTCLVRGYEKIPDLKDLLLPTNRAETEIQLNQIALGVANFNNVITDTLDKVYQKFMSLKRNFEKMVEVFVPKFKKLSDCGEPFGRCAKCKNERMRLVTVPDRLHCANCQVTYKLVKYEFGILSHCKQNRSLDGVELEFHQGFNGMIGVVVKSHWNCGGNGVYLLLKIKTGKWRLICSRCPATIDIYDGAETVKLTKWNCYCCYAKKIYVQYKQQGQYTGCYFCDPDGFSRSQVRSGFRGRMYYRGGRGRGSRY